MAFVYILLSSSLDKFYIGSCQDLADRLIQHREKTFKDAYTSNASDWELFLSIPDLDYAQARAIEIHIKKMKSKEYCRNLKKYPELVEKIKKRFSLDTGSSR